MVPCIDWAQMGSFLHVFFAVAVKWWLGWRHLKAQLGWMSDGFFTPVWCLSWDGYDRGPLDIFPFLHATRHVV